MAFTVSTLTLMPCVPLLLAIINTISSLFLTVNVVILVLLAVAFLIIVQRNLLNLSDFLHKENPGMFMFVLGKHAVCQLLCASEYLVHSYCEHLIR